MVEFSIWDVLRNLLLAARWTVALSLITFAAGGLVAIILVLIRNRTDRWGKHVVVLYVQLFQGTPLLMQLFLAYFGLSALGFQISAWGAASLALTLYCSAFLSEIWHGCIQAVSKGQWEASACLALNWAEQMRYIILPQAIKLAIPPTVGFMVQAVKATALASVIGFIELTKAGTMIANATFKPFMVFSIIGVLYFCLCYPISRYARSLERKMNVR